MKKTKTLKLDERTAKFLNRICDERRRLHDDYTEDPCITNFLHLQQMLKLEEDVFEIMGIDLAEFIFSPYRKY